MASPEDDRHSPRCRLFQKERIYGSNALLYFRRFPLARRTQTTIARNSPLPRTTTRGLDGTQRDPSRC